MYFEQAVRAHKEADALSAAKLYKKAYENKEFHEALFQNFGAALREIGDNDNAIVVYEEGLSRYPESTKISLNFANLLRETQPVRSLAIYLKILRYSLLNDDDAIHQSYVNVIEMLESLSCYTLAFSYCKSALEYKQNPGILLAIFRIASKASFSFLPSTDIATLANQAHVYITSFTELEKAEFYFALAWLHLNSQNVDQSRESLIQANECLDIFINQNRIIQAKTLRKLVTCEICTAGICLVFFCPNKNFRKDGLFLNMV